MRFLTALILSISFTVAGANAAEPVEKKTSRGKSILRAVGSFGKGVITVDPYQEVRSSKKDATRRPPMTTQPGSGTEAPQQTVEKSASPQ